MNSKGILKTLGVIITIAVLAGIILLLSNNKSKDKDKIKIGILQLAEHKALDDARQGFIDELSANGIQVEIDVKNAQGNVADAQIMANKFVSDNVDLVFAIATPAAQAAKQATIGKDIPVLFTAVTDPVYSELVSKEDTITEKITGVKDGVSKENIKDLITVIQTLKNSQKTIGIIYNIGESNSEIQIKEVKSVADEMGVSVETVGITTINDIPQAINTLSSKIDGLFLTSDNMVVSAIGLVAETAKEKGIITVTVDDTCVDSGIMFANGINYYELGKQTGIMAKKLFVDNIGISEIHVEEAKILSKKLNITTLEKLNISKDLEIFKDSEIVK